MKFVRKFDDKIQVKNTIIMKSKELGRGEGYRDGVQLHVSHVACSSSGNVVHGVRSAARLPTNSNLI